MICGELSVDQPSPFELRRIKEEWSRGFSALDTVINLDDIPVEDFLVFRESDGRMLGSAVGTASNGIIVIDFFWVNPEYRSLGALRKVFRSGFEYAKMHDCKYIFGQAQEKLMKVWRRFGAKVTRKTYDCVFDVEEVLQWESKPQLRVPH